MKENMQTCDEEREVSVLKCGYIGCLVRSTLCSEFFPSTFPQAKKCIGNKMVLPAFILTFPKRNIFKNIAILKEEQFVL